ncbi:hypothetical protein [Streptomyces nanshensis]|nr:hypothetical protein [Streptomyces nanshensis]
MLKEGFIFREDADGFVIDEAAEALDQRPGGRPFRITERGRYAVLKATGRRALTDRVDEVGQFLPNVTLATRRSLVALGLAEYREENEDAPAPAGDAAAESGARIFRTELGRRVAGSVTSAAGRAPRSEPPPVGTGG